MPAATGERPHFKTVQEVPLDYAPIKITQYESTRTGMRVAVVDQKGPKVNGYFALATEIHDDSGAPHTLEHLCFMGSKAYHYKGFLDKLATRQYSTTNAWTATDQTAYTLETAGWEAFANMLPVYLDHLIVPTLNDAGCYTEVHHVDGDGHDAGVVYSEMQGVQNKPEELMDLALKRAMYPEGNGFRYETGGMMEQLRTLTADRIRQFHKEMYQPKNMRLVITGEVDHDELLQVLDDFEGTILSDVPSLDAPFDRPWINTGHVDPIKEKIVQKVLFPEEDESMGEVFIGYLGPKYDDHKSNDATAVLLSYLCGSSISVLENTLVEKEQLCSAVYWQTEFRPEAQITFSLSAVETDKLDSVERRFIELMRETAAKPLDMDYMHDSIKRLRRQIISKCENAGEFFSTTVIEDHLFGRRSGEDLLDMQTLKGFDDLLEWTDSQWRDFLKKWFVDANHISILGVPSVELSKKITREEKARVKAQQERLGEAGLKKLAEKLKQAQDENNVPIPDSLLEQYPIPGADSIHFISTTSARGGSARREKSTEDAIQKIIDTDDNGSPLFFHFEHIPSNFVRAKVTMCTGSVPVDLKPLLSLYLSNFFATPVQRDGKHLEFEDVVLELEKETVSYNIGREYPNGELVAMSFNTEPERYEVMISWLRTMFFDAVHDPARLYASLTKILADIPDEKRSGDAMAATVLSMIQNQPASSIRAQATLSRALYLRRIRKLLKDNPETVVEKFAALCKALHRPENFRIYVAADLEKLKKPVTAWQTLIDDLDTSKPLAPLDSRRALLSEVGKNPGHTAYIVPIASIDSSFARLAAKGPDSYDHPDLPALLVAETYMDAVEGPLWRAVRGTGLAYGTGWSHSIETGLLSFKVFRSPDAHKAWAASKEQVEGLASGKIAFEKLMLEGAISEIVLNMASEQPNMAAAAEMSFINQVIRGIDKDHNHQILVKVRHVTEEQVKKVMVKYMIPAFKPESSNLVVTCSQLMAENLEKKFREEGFEPKVENLEYFQDDYGLKAPEGEEEQEEDDEEDGDDEDDDEAMDTPESDEEA
ncbi:hypothetical protein EJ03DRAFT_327018 [Teratosphaeria nubilosa]|uniref:Zinc metalloprotease n=1 Tax=Teratosphaeria nubilosa TaxID=161662 RepID=A0A6G1LAJ7_9PEZI|nr:hypothetical protein EJ03DRAFT_327018 [Teratosphaeria nubilosa]